MDSFFLAVRTKVATTETEEPAAACAEEAWGPSETLEKEWAEMWDCTID